MRLIGLTGTIASGKSTVSRYLSQLGAYIIDADIVAREVVERGTDGLKQLMARFGKSILNDDETLNRRRLAQTVFFDKQELNAMNEIMLPLILESMRNSTREIVKKDPNAAIVWDAALLIETDLYRDVDEIWLVTASAETQIARIMLRDSVSREQAEARIAAQMSESDKRRYATVVIENNGTESELFLKIDRLWEGEKC